MPEYNNGIPTNVQPEQNYNGGTLPGLNDNPMYQPQVGNLQVNSNAQNQMMMEPKDKADMAVNQKKGVLSSAIKKKIYTTALVVMAFFSANTMNAADYSIRDTRTTPQITEVQTLTRPGSNSENAIQLTTTDENGLEYKMFFDEEGSLVMVDHRNDLSPNVVGGRYLSEDRPDMDLSTPEKQEQYLMEMDQSRPGLTLQKEEVEKDIQEMGFKNKEEMEQNTGMDVNEALSKPDMDPNQTKEQLQASAADNILKNATMVVDGKTKFDTTRNVNDVLNTPGAKQIVGVGPNAFSIDERGNVKKENLRVQGTTPSVHVTQGYARDGRLDQTFSSVNNPTEGVGVGPGGSPQGVKNLTGEAAMTRSLNERGNTDTPTIDRLFEKHQDQGDHIEEMHGANGAEPISELHTGNDVTGLELQSISDRYGIPIDQVEQIYHNNLAHNMTREEALDNTQKTCDNIYSQNMHEPTLEPRSPFDAPNE